jgi:hypothetical protein
VRVFHVELRQFPRNTHAFNLSEDELRAGVLAPWLGRRIFELAGQRWRPEEARLTVLEGPQLEPHQLAMGRGWANALKRSEDVTRELLAAATDAVADADAVAAEAAAGAQDEGQERFAGFKAELLARSVEAPPSPREAWRLAGHWLPARPASERLSAAERAIRELLAEGLITLGRGAPATAAEHPVPTRELEAILLAWESWAADPAGIFLCPTSAGVHMTAAEAGSRQ